MKTIVISLLLFFVLTSCQETTYQLQKIKAETSVIDSIVEPEERISSFINPFKVKVDAEVNKIITYASNDLSKNDGKLQSSLGNIMADVMYDKANSFLTTKTGQTVDFAMSNHGGIRTTIFKGDVTIENVYKLMPFENRIVITELSYEKVLELFDYFIKEQRAHPLSKQVQISIQNNKEEITINGKSLEKNKTYFVATSDYLQEGGDKMTFFREPKSLFDTNTLFRDAIIDYFSKKDTLKANFDNRIIKN